MTHSYKSCIQIPSKNGCNPFLSTCQKYGANGFFLVFEDNLPGPPKLPCYIITTFFEANTFS